MTFNPIEIAKELLQTNAARLIAWSSAAAVAGAVAVAAAVGVELPPEVQIAVATAATFVATELIRRFVWSKDTRDEDVAAAYQAGLRDAQPD